MSATGRAVDLLDAWKDHPRDCDREHPWGDDTGETHDMSAADVLDAIRDILGVVA